MPRGRRQESSDEEDSSTSSVPALSLASGGYYTSSTSSSNGSSSSSSSSGGSDGETASSSSTDPFSKGDGKDSARGPDYWHNNYTYSSSDSGSGSGSVPPTSGHPKTRRVTISEDPSLVIQPITHSEDPATRWSWGQYLKEVAKTQGLATGLSIPSIIIFVVLSLFPYYDSDATGENVTFNYRYAAIPTALTVYSAYNLTVVHLTNLWVTGSEARQARMRSTINARTQVLAPTNSEQQHKTKNEDKVGPKNGRDLHNASLDDGGSSAPTAHGGGGGGGGGGLPSADKNVAMVNTALSAAAVADTEAGDLENHELLINQFARKALRYTVAQRKRARTILYVIVNVIAITMAFFTIYVQLNARHLAFDNTMFFIRFLVLVCTLLFCVIFTWRFIPWVSLAVFLGGYIFLFAITLILSLVIPIFTQTFSPLQQLLFRVVVWPVVAGAYRLANRFLTRHALLNNYGNPDVLFVFPFYFDLGLTIVGRVLLNSIDSTLFLFIAVLLTSVVSVLGSFIHIPFKRWWVTRREGAEHLDVVFSDVAYLKSMSRNIYSNFIGETVAVLIPLLGSSLFYRRRLIFDWSYATVLEKDKDYFKDYFVIIALANLLQFVCNVVVHSLVLRIKHSQLPSLSRYHVGYTFKRHNAVYWVWTIATVALNILLIFRTSPSSAFCEEDKYSSCCFPLAPRKFNQTECIPYNSTGVTPSVTSGFLEL